MFGSRLQKAFALTDPHPLDERVRLTVSPSGLGAIFSKEVRAVIWSRTLPADVNDAVDTMNFKNCGSKISLRAPFVRSRPWGTKIIRQPDEDTLTIPSPILKDMAKIAGHFRKAQGLLQYDTSKFLDIVTCYNFGKKPDNKEYRDPLRPHHDGPFYPRLITSYSTHPEMGTVWYPGNIDNKVLRDFSSQLGAANDPVALLSQFDTEYSAQSVQPNDVILIKGMVEGVGIEEILAHRAATPLVDARRLTLVIS